MALPALLLMFENGARKRVHEVYVVKAPDDGIHAISVNVNKATH